MTQSQKKETEKKHKHLEIATFYIGDALCGIDILKIQEINKLTEFTWAPNAPEYVLGVMNLRGKIVTVIDIGKKLGLSPIQKGKENRNIIIDSRGECIGLLVDSVCDVVSADENAIDQPPPNIGGLKGSYFEGVYKTDKNLIGILDVEEVFKDE